MAFHHNSISCHGLTLEASKIKFLDSLFYG